jgi:long-chain acyl-CoA synthetase
MYTFAQPLNRALRTASESPAVVCQDNRRTYAELGSRCRRLAGAMHKLGLAPQDRVGVIALNSDRYLELYLGLPAAGYVLVPVNSRLAPAEMRAILDDAGVSVVFADADYPGAAGVSQVLTMPDDYEDLLAAADEIPLGEGVGEDDLAALFYTSGTTGAPKGAMHTHRSLVSSALHFMATWPFDRQTRWLVASPMFHTGGILATLATVWAGGTHVIMPRFDPDLAVDLIEREAVTHTLLVPTMLAAAAGAQLARPRNVRSLRYLSHGASPISAETLRRTRQAFPGAELLHVYGTTETTPITTLLPHEERILDTPLVRSCGQPAVGVEIRILDDALDELPPRTVGQIAVRSPSVMAGYWRKPHETAEAMRGDWYLSGDLGYRDQDSYIYLVDRVKDMIVSGGENIYSTEVEDALATYPGVEEVAVFGVPDPRWGESVYAIVFCRGPVTPGELIAHCREQIAGFKVPRCIELRTEALPKSAAGKILKRELREPHWAGQQAQVSGG